MVRSGGIRTRFVPFELLCQILPEEWLIGRNQQVGSNFRKPRSPSFAFICRGFAAVFCKLRYIFVTADIYPFGELSHRWARFRKRFGEKLENCLTTAILLP